MSQLQRTQRDPALVDSRPAGTPLVTDDGRPFVTEESGKDDLALWLPKPPRAGDAVYCQGVRIGVVQGDTSNAANTTAQCGWWIDTLPTRDLPPEMAHWLRENRRSRSFAAAD